MEINEVWSAIYDLEAYRHAAQLHIVCDKLEITSFRQKSKIKQLSDLIFDELLRCSPPQSAPSQKTFRRNLRDGIILRMLGLKIFISPSRNLHISDTT